MSTLQVAVSNPPAHSSERRGLLVAEILSSIVQFTTLKDAARCARVCKYWRDISLDYIWRQLPGLRPLFEILAPLVSKPENLNGPLEFSRPITLDDWNRLEPFLLRVRKLTLDVHDRKGASNRFLDDSVFDSVNSSLPFTTMLPNLHHLAIINQGNDFDRARKFVPILSNSIRTLDLHVLRHPTNVDNLAFFMQEAKDRAPNIQQITLSDRCRRAVFDERFQELIPKFVNLENIIVSSCSLNPTNLSALSTLPRLRDVRLRDFGANNGRLNEIKHIDNVVYRLDQDPPFPSLQSLTLQTQLSSASKFLASRIDPSILIRLSIDVISHMPIKALSDFLELVARKCPGMTQLDLFRIEDVEHLVGEPIPSDTLKSLKLMKYLETFTLSSTSGYGMSDIELAQLILSCRSLKCFRLLRDPISVIGRGTKNLTLNLLSILADSREGFSLDELNLDVDATGTPCMRSSNSPKLHIGRLVFAYSNIRRPDIFKVASYLDSLFDRNASTSVSTQLGIISDLRKNRIEGILDEDDQMYLHNRLEAWKLVSGALELISETRRRVEEEIKGVQAAEAPK